MDPGGLPSSGSEPDPKWRGRQQSWQPRGRTAKQRLKVKAGGAEGGGQEQSRLESREVGSKLKCGVRRGSDEWPGLISDGASDVADSGF